MLRRKPDSVTRTPRRVGRLWVAGALVAAVATSSIGIESASSARSSLAPASATCQSKPWTKQSYQTSSTPDALAVMVLGCMKKLYPRSYVHDEVGIVSLNAYPWFQNVNEFGLTSTVQQQLASLGMPPITLQDGPGGVITKTSPSPTAMPNELALGATFDPLMATLYGATLGAQAKAMGYDGMQAPNLNVIRVASWGRASEAFSESPVLVGTMGAAETIAIEGQHLIPVLKHFGPYSQETNRKFVNQQVAIKALEEVYVRPFTFALRALLPQLHAWGHAVAIMCSYGNVNATKACRSPVLNQELASLGINALVRSDLDVKVDPSALLQNGVDLIKPMNTGELARGLAHGAVVTALDQAVIEVFRTEFAAGLVNGTVAAKRRPLPRSLSNQGRLLATVIMQRAAVLLKNTGVLPLTASSGKVAVIADNNMTNTCVALSQQLAHALGSRSTCTNDAHVSLPSETLFQGLPIVHKPGSRVRNFTAKTSGPYVVTVTTMGNTKLTINGKTIISTQGLAEFKVQRTVLVRLTARTHYSFVVTWRGAPPSAVITREQAAINAAVSATNGAKVAIVIVYDLAREGMDRSSLVLPGNQEAIISAVAARVPTIVLLASDGAVTMPWLGQVQGVLEVWNPTGGTQLDRIASQYVPAWVHLLDGAVNPSGRLPLTFPATAAQSPMGDPAFWPGLGSKVDLNRAPNTGVGIGMPWYRTAGWPVLFPFGYGLSYTTYQLLGGSLTTSGKGLQMTVGVRDTGGVAGVEPIQVYANFPTALGEPRSQLVGFGTATFTKADAQRGTVLHVGVQISPDALSVWSNGSMRIVKGGYCLQASTYSGDPRSWSTGSVTLSPGASGLSVATTGTSYLSWGSCPS